MAISNSLAVPPDTASRTELKEWIFDHVEPCMERTTAYVIRKLTGGRKGYYYCGEMLNKWGDYRTVWTPMWTPNINSQTVRQFPRVEDARAQFSWKLWIGNWLDSFLPRRWRRVIPWRHFEIVEVYNVWEYCDVDLQAQVTERCRHRRTYL